MGSFSKLKLTTADKVYQTFIMASVGLMALSCLFPLFYVLGMSFTSEWEMVKRNYFVIFPTKPIVRTYSYILGHKYFWNSMGISVARTLLGVVASLAFNLPAGYIIAKQELRGRKLIMIYFIVTMLLNGGIIPSYLLMNKLGLIDSFWVFIVPGFSGVFNMLIIKIFVENIPGEIMESAEMDGATEIQKLIRIAIPLLVPTIAALGLFAAVAHWNSWFDAMLYIRNQALYPVQFLIRTLMMSTTQIESTTGQLTVFERITPEGVKMAAVIVAVFPILCVYPFIQKYFIYGAFTGSVKG